MKYDDKLLDQWLAGAWLDDDNSDVEQIWEPGFSADRQVVMAKFGPFIKLYERPEKFVKRFYHRVFRLNLEDWQLVRRVVLYSGFCTIDAEVDIRFQASIKYALANNEILSNINQHIKQSFEGLVFDIVDKQLNDLDDGGWIKTGLVDIEKAINNDINELFLLKNVQCRALTTLKPEFVDQDEAGKMDARFVHESVYMHIAQKNAEFNEKKRQEKLRQQQAEAQLSLQMIKDQEELLQQQQAQEAENIRLRLLNKEEQQNEQHLIEKRIHNESTQHVIQMRELAAEADLEAEEALQQRQFKMEQKLQMQQLAHESRLKEKKTLEEVKDKERSDQQWNQVNQRSHEEKLRIEKEQRNKEIELEMELKRLRELEELKNKEKLVKEKIMQENRLKDLELEANVMEQKKRYDATNRSADYLRREIELLVLEKQRTELNQAIQSANEQDDL